MPIFEHNGTKYNVQDRDIQDFTNEFPEATILEERNGTTYRVKPADYKFFQADFRSMQAPLEEPSEDELQAIKQEEEDKYAIGFKEGWDQGWIGMKAGVQYLAGETANFVTGTSRDDAQAYDELTRRIENGEPITEENRPWLKRMADKWLSNHPLTPPALREASAGRVEQDEINKIINQALEDADGDIDKARRIIAKQKILDKSWGDKVMEDAASKMNELKPTKGFGAWAGNLLPQMIPAGAAIAATAITKNPKFATMIGKVGTGAMTAATVGQSMKEARDAGASDSEVWSSGVADGVIEYATEKIPLDRYTRRLFGNTAAKMGAELAEAVADGRSPARKELEQLLKEANKRMGGRLLNGKNVKNLAADILAEGSSEFLAEAVQTITPIIYENPENYPAFAEILSNGWEGAKAGIFMGSVLGGASKATEHRMQRNRRKQQGYVDIAQAKDENGASDIVEIVGLNQQNGNYIVLRDGETSEVKPDQIEQNYRFSFDEFDRGVLQSQTDESYDNGYSLETSQELNDAKNMLEVQTENIRRTYGLDENVDIDEFLGDDPIEGIMLSRKAGASEDEQQTKLDYINAKATYDGMLQRIRDDIDSQVEANNQRIDQVVNRDTKMIVPAKMKLDDRPVYIVGGNVVLHDDGSVNNSESAQDIIIYDEAKGGFEFTSPSAILEVGQSLSADELKATQASQIAEQYATTKGDQIDGVLPFAQGDTYNILGEDGVQHTAQIIADNGDGSVQVAMDGATEAVVMPKQQVQAMSQAYNKARAVAYNEQKKGKEVAQPRKLTLEEVDTIISAMESNAVPAPEIELTPENWVAEFGENGIVATPIGDVKMGENQYFKLAQKGRESKLGMIKPTLESPDFIVEEKSSAKDSQVAERNSSYVFVKAFTNADGTRTYKFTSVTIRKDGREVVISNQEKETPRIKRLLREGMLTYISEATLPSEPTHSTQGDQQTIPSGATLSDSKGTISTPQNQEVEQKNISKPVVPTQKDGTPDYNAMDADMFTEQYVSQFGEDITETVARNNIKEADKKIASIKKQIESITDPNKLPALYAQLQEAEVAKAKYTAVVENLGLSEDADESNASRVQRMKQDATPRIAQLFPDGLPNVEAVILADIATGNKIRWSDKVVNGAVVSKGLGAELGLAESNAERTRRIALIGKDAPTPEEYAEQLRERLDAMGIRYDESELRDKVIDVYSSTDTRSKAWEQLEEMSADMQAYQDALDYEEEQMRRAYEQGISGRPQDVDFEQAEPEIPSQEEYDQIAQEFEGEEVAPSVEDTQGERTDKQGNRVNQDGDLIIEVVESIDEITDEDFENPHRTIQLPQLPQNVNDAIGADGKPVVIKKNIFERNAISHSDLTPDQSRQILKSALYSTKVYGQNQKKRKPYNWVVISVRDEATPNKLVLLEVNEGKENVEIIHWHYIDQRGLEKLKRQAEREDGQLLILPSENSEEVGALADPTLKLPSDSKDTTSEPKSQEVAEKILQAEAETNIEPSEAQKEAGNYKKGHVSIDGLNITIENPKDTERSGVDENGQKWSVKMNNTYGYIRRTEGKDGDHIDLFLSDHIDDWNGNVFVVDQVKPDGSFDEHKVMYGFDTIEEAEQAYMSNYSIGWKGLGAITGTSKGEFKKWLDSSHRKTKPFAEYKNVKKEERTATKFLSKDAYVQSELDKEKPEGMDMQEYEETDEYVDAYNAAIDSYASYIEGLAKSGELQKMYDSATIGEQIAIRKGVEAAGFEFRDLVTPKKVTKTAKKSRGQELMDNLGLQLLAEDKSTSEVPQEDALSQESEQTAEQPNVQQEIQHLEEIKNYPGADKKAVQKEIDRLKASITEEPQAIASEAFSIEPAQYTNKRGKILDMHLVKFADTLTKEQQRAAKELAKAEKGWYDREQGGFMMRSEESAKRLADTILNNDDAVSDAQPVSLTDMQSVSNGEVVFTELQQPKQATEGKNAPVWQYSISVDPDGFTTLRREDISGAVPVVDAFFTKHADEPQEMLDILRNPLNGMQEILDVVGTTLENQIATRELNRKIEAERRRKYEELRQNGVNGFKIGDKVLYTPEGRSRKPIEATIHDFEEFGANNPVLDVGLAPIMYETTEWKNISKDGRQISPNQGNVVRDSNPSGNKLVSDERYAELRERMRKKLGGQMNIGIDPEILAIGTEMAVYHLEKGARKFTEYAKAMIADLGDAIRPYLKAFYNGARNLPEVEDSEIATDMTPYNEVQLFDVANFDKANIDATATAETVVRETEVQQEVDIAQERIKKTRAPRSKKEKKSVTSQEPSLFGEPQNESENGTDENSAANNRGTELGSEELPEAQSVGARTPVQDTAGDRQSKRMRLGDSSRESRSGSQYDVNKNYSNEEISEIVSSITDIVDGKVVITGAVTDDIKAVCRQYKSGGIAKKGRGILDEYYTDGKIVDAVSMLIAPYFKNTSAIRVLEPSVGVGNFIEATRNMRTSDVVAFEINDTTARIAKVLYPNVDVNLRSFETEFIDDSGNKKPLPKKFNLVIGNPPYGSHRGLYKGLGEESKIARYEDYFVKRSLDVLEDGGVLAMVLPSSWIDRHTKYGGYTIEAAYRLPSGAFEATQVGTDIVVLKKDSSVPTSEHTSYFEKHPDRILGEVKQRKGRYGRLEEYVEGNIDAALEAIERDHAKQLAARLDVDETSDNLNDIQTAIEETGSVDNAEAIVKNAQEEATTTKDEQTPIEEEAAQSKYKVNLNRSAETAPTSAQFTHEFSEGEIEAFEDTNYDGTINDPTTHAKYANFVGERYVHDFYYAEGDIYAKLAQLEDDRDIIIRRYGVEQYEKQKRLLESVLPKRKGLDEITISPNTAFVKNLTITTESGRESLKNLFEAFCRKLPYRAFGDSTQWEVIGYINNEQVYGQDKQRNQLIRERRKRVANELFVKFLNEELSDDGKRQVVAAFNREYNSVYRPDYSKVPMFSTINKDFKGKPLKLTSVQLAGIGRMTVKGVGVLAHEVGFGKTLSGILAMHEAMTRGFASKPLIVVPNDNILKQWVETMKEVLPESTVNVLGNLGASYDLTGFKVNDGEFTIVTYEGLKAMSFSDSTYNHLAEKFSYITEDLSKHQSERDYQKEIEKKNELKGKMKRGVKPSYGFEDFGFDWLTVDEVHNANHIVSKVRLDKSIASDFRSQSQRTSDLGLKTWLAAQYIQEENNGRNVLLLSATPFTNKPLEYYSILSLVANDMLRRKGFFNVDQFFATFMEADNELEIAANGRPVQKTNVRRFRNNGLFQQLLSEFIDIKGEEDNPDLVRPTRQNKEYKIAQNELTAEAMAEVQDLLSDNEKVLQGIGHARAAAFSPYATSLIGRRPKNHKEFVKNSPKIDATIKLIEQNKKDRPDAGQIIYSEVGVEFFPMIRDYLVHESGFKSNEVRIITGATSNNERVNIQTAFNKGEVKVVIGSPAIKEGLNLQENTTDMYILSLPWNFTQLRQIEGRGWRQGNKWENIRINYMLTNDSVDVFMLQRLQLKQGLYNEAMKSGAESLDVSDIDTAELKTQLITDPAVRAEIVTVQEREKLQQEKTQIEADLSFVTRKFEGYNKLVDALNRRKRNLEQFKSFAARSPRDEYWSKRAEDEARMVLQTENEIEQEKENLRKKGVNIDDIDRQVRQSQAAIEAIQKRIEGLDDFQQELTEKFIREDRAKAAEQGNNLSAYIKERKKENQSGFYKIRPKDEDVRFRVADTSFAHAEEVASNAQKIADKFGLSNEIIIAETQEVFVNELQSENVADELINPDAIAVFTPSGRIMVNAQMISDIAELPDSIMHEFAHNVTHIGSVLYRLQDTVLEVGEERFEVAGREIFGQTADPLEVADEIIATFVGNAANPTLYDGEDLVSRVFAGYSTEEAIRELLGSLPPDLYNGYADVVEAVMPYVKEVLDAIKTNHDGPRKRTRASEDYRDAQAETGRVRISVQGYSGSAEAETNRFDNEANAMRGAETSAHTKETRTQNEYNRKEGLQGYPVPGLRLVGRGRVRRDLTALRESANELASQLNTPIRIVEDVNTITDNNAKLQERKRNAKGFYDRNTNEVVVVLPNATSVEDVRETIFHEVVGHKGLQALVGKERFNAFLDKVFANASEEVREKIARRAAKLGWDFHEATEEYIAEQAEQGFEERENRNFFEVVRDLFLDMLSKAKIALGYRINDNDLRYMLWRTYQMQRSKGAMAVAEDIVMQHKLGVGNFRARRIDREGNEIGDGSYHVPYKVDSTILDYPNVSYEVAESNSTESVYVTYYNNDPKYSVYERPKVTVRFSNHGSNSSKFGDVLPGSLNESERQTNEILARLGLKKATPIHGKSIPTVSASNADIESGKYEEADITKQELYALPIGADISQYRGKRINGTREIINTDNVKQSSRIIGYNFEEIPEVEAQRKTTRVNAEFNEQLDSLTDENAREVILNVGMPSPLLRAYGVEDKPIRLYGAKLLSKIRKHGYKLNDVKNLPLALQSPIAIFKGSDVGSFAILTELRIGSNNVLATLSVGKGGHDVDFNIITSVYDKRGDSVIRWINSDRMLYVNKEKALNYLSVSVPVTEAQDNRELESATKVVEDFDNSKHRVSKNMPDERENIIAKAQADGSNTTFDSDNDDIRFRDGGSTPSPAKPNANARDVYNYAVRRPNKSGSVKATHNLDFRLREAYQDSMLALKELQNAILKETGKTMRDWEDAYTAQNHMSSKNQAEAEAYKNNFFKPLMEEVAKLATNGTKYEDVIRYLIAKHGLERNRVFSERDAKKEGKKWDGKIARDYSGLTDLTGEAENFTEAAEAIVKEFEKKHNTDELWERINAATKNTLKKNYDSGLISKEDYEYVRNMFKYYIPLRGWDVDVASDEFEYLTSNRPLLSPSLKAAKGRLSLADDPLATIGYMAESAIIQGNRNNMKIRFLNFVLNNPTSLATVNRRWVVEQADGTWRYDDPIIPGDATADEVDAIVKAHNEKMRSLGDKATQKTDGLNLDLRASKQEGQEHTIRVRRNGVEYLIFINGDPAAAQAINGLTNPDVSESILRKGATYVKNLMARAFTSQNPAFIIWNLVRDVIWAGTAVRIKEDAAYANRHKGNVTALLTSVQLPKLIKKFQEGTLDPNNEIERYFKEFVLNGGETGYTQINTAEDYKRDIKRILKEATNGVPIPKKAWRSVFGSIEFLNRNAEDLSRFAVYMTSRQQGRSISRSVTDAKEMTVNFNRKGRGGLGADWINFAYIFSNAAIQSITNFASLMKNHPARTMKALAAFTSAGFMAPLISMMAYALLGDDEETYWDIPEWVRRNNIVLPIPFSKGYLTISLPHELRPFYAIGELAMSVLLGKEEVEDALMEAAKGFTNLIPVDLTGNGGNLIVNLTPTALQPIAQIIANKDYFGTPIYKKYDYNEKEPEWTKAYRGTNAYLVDATRWLNEITGGDNHKRGVINLNPAVIEHLFESYLGGVGKTLNKTAKTISMIWDEDSRMVRNIPVVSGFIQVPNKLTSNSNLNEKYYDAIDEFKETERILRGYKRDARMGSGEYAEKLSELIDSPTFQRYQQMKGYKDVINELSGRLVDVDPTTRNELDTLIMELKVEMLDELEKLEDQADE